MHQILGVDRMTAVQRESHPYTRNEGVWGGGGAAMKEAGQHQAPAALHSGKDSGTH